MHPLLTEVHHNLTLRAQDQQIELISDLQPVPVIRGDYDRLIQLFTNLLDNALNHTPAGGRVHLRLKPQGEQAVEVTVQDSGSGISPEDLSRIFERFYQVEKSRVGGNGRRGSGLGLAIVHELVEAHQGSIRAVSQEGEGSLFVVRLPVNRGR
ncbi:MAG: ATP-binding protein [Chloroflexi bacterium]|nr:ATP-binding protein [Chloroflexota bacterium]